MIHETPGDISQFLYLCYFICLTQLFPPDPLKLVPPCSLTSSGHLQSPKDSSTLTVLFLLSQIWLHRCVSHSLKYISQSKPSHLTIFYFQSLFIILADYIKLKMNYAECIGMMFIVKSCSNVRILQRQVDTPGPHYRL